MSNVQTPVESTVDDDLDTFSDVFFGRKAPDDEQASSEKVETDTTEDDAQEDTQPEDDTLANDEDEDEVVEEAPEDAQPKPKKNRFQERIDELTAGKREAERKAADLEARLAKLEQTSKPAPIVEAAENTGPTPEDTNEDGTDKYPLGEFDPNYIRDLTRHTLQTEREALKKEEEEKAQQTEMEAQRAALQTSWEEKLVPAQERYPDFREKGEALVDSFSGLEPAYAEYLTATLMSMEYGPDVLYYLSKNPAEAHAIVNSGATKATIALGRLESKFAFAEEEKQRRPKVSQAPTPPVHLNKGSAVVKVEVPDDTDDLDAFANKFFDKKRRRT